MYCIYIYIVNNSHRIIIIIKKKTINLDDAFEFIAAHYRIIVLQLKVYSTVP